MSEEIIVLHSANTHVCLLGARLHGRQRRKQIKQKKE